MLYPDKAPKTVANFLQYVNDGFYTGTLFHRVIDGFMIRGGGFTADFTQKPTRAGIENIVEPVGKAMIALRVDADVLAWLDAAS